MTLRMSNAHLGVTHPPPQLAPHAVELDSPEEVVPSPSATDILSNLIAPPPVEVTTFDPKIVDAIMDEHDIKIVRDTLSALSQRHFEFITEGNNFINSIRCR
ncbi:hypothetical protein Acr_00g0017750 [Actinidia rufa]|uniref:Uncharacterized protein n=1 Tax=Actinidia rufa TaxID=165716 RepID=A0A7J0DD25_9ERIC|nr:hypothetical protein Acr_00g0017750 [Actinidia rufa]